MNDNFIICSFLRFAGGKFIGNCLALSNHFCPRDAKCAEYLISCPDDYNFRLTDLIEKFWQSYIALHVDNVDLM